MSYFYDRFSDRLPRRLKPSRHQDNLPLFDKPAAPPPPHPEPPPSPDPSPPESPPSALFASAPPESFAVSSGEKGKARDILVAIRTLKSIEQENRLATPDEKAVLSRFCGFGPVALSLFPDPITGHYKDGWQPLGDELKSLLTPEEYDSAKRTTFSQFFTSPTVMLAMHNALLRLGVHPASTVLEPGCGIGNFISQAPESMRFIGVELDSLSGRIARALNPKADIRIENFRDTKLPPLDAVIGNVPFADIKLDFHSQKLSLHDFFIAKSVDALKPWGVLAVVTSHFTLDKQNAAVREQLASQADLVGAIRLPSDAFKKEGTAVVTDILFLRKRAPGQEPNHAAEWIPTGTLALDGATVPVNGYFLKHPEMVLGDWSRKDTLYGSEGYSVVSNGDLAGQLKEAIGRLPQVEKSEAERANPPPISQNAAPPPFIPPPPLKHVTEGSFFVNDRTICQLEDGQAKPVVYCGTTWRTDGTPQARKAHSLIKLRDLARRVLQSQNEGWPESAREQARRDLNQAYDLFTAGHGPINKTTFTTTKDGGTIRRMPNLVKFKEDPDAMLVMSLEEYDEATGTAQKSAIMKKDVVGPKPPVTHVSSAEDGLLVSLDHRGAVDLPYIAKLYGKPEGEITAELGDLIYRDPETKQWQTADAYLSGNVREKLAAAERAGITRNIEALRQVQPEDVLPGDIDANLGAPWIPDADIKAFAAELFNVPGDAIKIGHLKKDAVWSVDPDYRALNSVAATADYGTPRINGTALLESALNLKSPVIYDLDSEKRPVVNQNETLAAKEKQRAIKDRFKSWVFSDPDRTERLVRIYNDTYNNLRPRLFDGSHLDFPGMSKTKELDQHQKDAVWRCMSAGSTLLAHCVGAGKSAAIATACMKMRQAGLIKKPLVAVPNNCLEQFAREFQQWYPNAKLLIATKEDMERHRRKALTAKIATGDWDAVITTHSSFERIGMSQEYQARFLREQIAEYDVLLKDSARADTGRGNRNILKSLEKQKAKREEKLKDLLAEGKKDSGLVFDELGVDQIFYDEQQTVKNMETPTKMDRVAGIQTGGSERAFDFYMKARYLDEKHPGHGMVGASGTPISNSMVEMYTLQRYFDLQGLKDRGIEHFDAWAATFGEVVDTMEISPDGATLKPRSRFAKFTNLPELSEMFRSFADVKMADDLNLPRPALEGGKPQTIACPMSDEQAELQAGLVKRYERIRSEKVDPREDNALNITTDGRKLALDARLLSSTSLTPQVTKSDLMADIIVAGWKKGESKRTTQLVFCDMGVHPTAWGFSVYDDIISKLTSRGIPRNQIAVAGDADTDAKKQALFEKVRAGTVRVLIGSTQKMGTGTNVQKRLVALHHLDAPWKPAEVEQREGRILRQGNQNEEVAIYRYVTEGSFDAYMWQALETKARFINQVMSGDCAVRKAEDIGGQELSYAEVKAIASGNPAVLTLAEADAELQRLAILRKNHLDEQFLAKRSLRDLPGTIRRLETRHEGLTKDMASLTDDLSPSTEALGMRLNRLPEAVHDTKRCPLGQYRGLEFGVILHPMGGPEVYLEGVVTRRAQMVRENPGPRAVLNALERLAEGYAGEIAHVKEDLSVAQGQERDYRSRVGTEFAHGEYLRQLTDLRDALRLGLSEKPPEGGEPVAVLAEKIKALRAGNAVEAAPVRAGSRKATRAETPVTARIKRKAEDVQVEEAVAVSETALEQPMEMLVEPIAITLPEVANRSNGHRQAVVMRRGDEAQGRLF